MEITNVGRLFCLFLAVLSPAIIKIPTHASEFESNQDFVVDCISKIGEETDWEACRAMMFEPCKDHTVGGSGHVACLTIEKKAWDEHLTAYLELLNSRLTISGAATLGDSVGQWYEYRQARCNSVAQERAAIGFNPEAAGYGCMIAETAGIVSDLDSCLKGKSTAPYCAIKE